MWLRVWFLWLVRVTIVTARLHRNFFTTLPYTTNVYTTESAVDALQMTDCPLVACPDTPTCGSDCQMYPSSCYMQFVACTQNITLQEMEDSYCFEKTPLVLQPLPATVELLYGGSVQLTCGVVEGGVASRVSWFEVRSATVLEISSSPGTGSGDVLNITDVKEDRYFFCQVSNCNQQIVQSTTTHVTIPENVCMIYGTGHFYTFTEQSYSYQSECTYVAAMDALRGTWFVYARFERTWQISSASLSTVTFYYNHVPVELQRGWVVNYFGRKVVVREGESKDMFGMHLTFDGLYLKLSTPEVTLNWDGLGSLIIGVPLNTPTCGLCGSNNREDQQLHHRYHTGGSNTIQTLVKSWSLNKRQQCVYQDDLNSVAERSTYDVAMTRDVAMTTPRANTSAVVEGMCDRLRAGSVGGQIKEFYRSSCVQDTPLTDLMVGSTPTYCWSQLALFHLLDKLSNNITTTGGYHGDSASSNHGDSASSNHGDSASSNQGSAVCSLSVLRRQYLTYYAGCPNGEPPFDVT